LTDQNKYQSINSDRSFPMLSALVPEVFSETQLFIAEEMRSEAQAAG